jgi:NhaP-type Na+/H+ or K+/H+ antiporter
MSRMRSTNGLLLGLILGLGCTVFGGYIAGWLAKRSEVLHGAIVAAAGMAVAFAFQEDLPTWYDIAGYAAMLPAGMLGGRLARLRRERN